MPGYLGNDPAGSATKIARQTYTTSGAATTDFTFTSGYDVGYLDVYVNGERQTKGKNFTASDGSTFKVLNGGVGTGSTVEAIAYKTFNLATVDFDDLGNTGNLTLTGDISGVNATFTGDVSIGGTLTYEDVTNIDSVGVITARAGVDIITGGIDIVGNTTGLNVTGVSTFAGPISVGDTISLGDHDRLRFGASNDLQIYHNASHSIINNSTGDLRIEGDRVELLNNASNEFLLTADADGSVDLYHNGNKKFETTSSGAIVTGIATVITTTAADSSNVYNFVVRGNDSGTDDESAQIFLGAINATTRGTAIAAQRQSSSNNHDLIFKTSAAGAVPTERVRITDVGRVGINTSSADGMLHIKTLAGVSGNENTVKGLVLQENSFSSANLLELQNSVGGGIAAFDQAGQLGIGTVSPSSSLHVDGGTDNLIARFESSDAGARIELKDNHATSSIEQNSNEFIFNSDSGAADGSSTITFKVDGSEAGRFDSSGRFMLGTTSTGPSTADDLTIATSGNTGISIRSGTSSAGNIFFSDGTSGDDQTRGVIQYDHSSNYMRLYTDNNERLRITSDGDLLIGTTSNGGGNRLYVVDNFADSFVNPSDSVLRVENANDAGDDVQASISLTSQTTGSNADSAIVSQAEDGSGNSSLQFWTDTSNGMSEKLRISSTGKVTITGGSTNGELAIKAASASGNDIIQFQNSGGTTRGNITYDTDNNFLLINVNQGEKFRIHDNGDVSFDNTTVTTATLNVEGIGFEPRTGSGFFSRDGGSSLYINRKSSDGNLVNFYQDGTQHGQISVSGNDISYGTFCGSHWGRLEDGSKPEILRGTILETINKAVEWKVIEFTVDGEQKRQAYNGSEENGASVTVEYEGVTYTGTVADEVPDSENLNKHVCVKVSDTAASKAVFGVFLGWDEDEDERIIGLWNDMNIAALGNYYIRIKSGQSLEIGDLIESDGTGCGVVQSDDIIRSKTVAKVTSTTPQKVYTDGSFLVTCVLYSG